MAEVFDFGGKTPNFDKSQIIIFSKSARASFFQKSIFPFTNNGHVDKPIIYLNRNGEIEEIIIISAICIGSTSYGFIFSLFNKAKGVRSQNENNYAKLFNDFAVVYPDDKEHFIIDIELADDSDGIIDNDDVNSILNMVKEMINSDTIINNVKAKYDWDSNYDRSIIIGTCEYK